MSKKASCDNCGEFKVLYQISPHLAYGIDTAVCADCLDIPLEDRDEDEEE